MIAVAILSITAAIECGIVFQHILRCNLAAWDDWLEVSKKRSVALETVDVVLALLAIAGRPTIKQGAP